MAAGFEAIRAVENRLHPTRPGSELARLNRAEPGRRLPVHPSTVTVLRLCRELHRQSSGRFEPALPGRGSVMHWQPAGPGAVIVRRRACIDLGGIAKGYAVDLAVEAMRRAGAVSGLVNAGGDLRVFGPRAWPIWLRSGSGAARELLLRDCALAASDPDAPDSPPEHRGYYAGQKAWRRQAVRGRRRTRPERGGRRCPHQGADAGGPCAGGRYPRPLPRARCRSIVVFT